MTEEQQDALREAVAERMEGYLRCRPLGGTVFVRDAEAVVNAVSHWYNLGGGNPVLVSMLHEIVVEELRSTVDGAEGPWALKYVYGPDGYITADVATRSEFKHHEEHGHPNPDLQALAEKHLLALVTKE